MKLRTILTTAAALAISSTAIADPVVYEIESNYSAGNFSASWMHGATGCQGWGPNTEDKVYMCGDPLLPITGFIEGDLSGGVLNITGGTMNVGGTDYEVYEGQLGAFGGSAIWGINIEFFGEFLFESFLMGSGMPNMFDGDTMILWGQNLDAYAFDPGLRDAYRWGMDLYATRVSVPEPSVLALMLVGLAGVAVASRRRRTQSLAVAASA